MYGGEQPAPPPKKKGFLGPNTEPQLGGGGGVLGVGGNTGEKKG